MVNDKKTSRVWQFFTDLKNDKAKCNFCGKVMSYKGGGASNLIRHTKSFHQHVFSAVNENPPSSQNTEQLIDQQPTSTSCSSSLNTLPSSSNSTTKNQLKPCNTKQSQQGITGYLTKPLSAKKNEVINETVIRMFAKNYLAFNLVEAPEFRELVQQLNPAYNLPSRKTLSNALLTNLYLKTKETVLSEIKEADYVCLTTDGWTSKPNDNYLSVTAHFFNEKAEMKSFLLECIQYSDRHTAENLANELKKVAEAWEICLKIVAVTTDNAHNIKAAIKLNHWKQIPCFAHTLNLIVQTGLKELKGVTTKIKNIVELFRRSPLAAERLRKMQTTMGEPELKLKQDVPTRWNSTYVMFKRVLDVKNSLMSTMAINYPDMDNINNEDIEILSGASEVLSIFNDVTEDMSAEKCTTISQVILLANALRSKCEKFLGRNAYAHGVIKMVEVLSRELNLRFSQIEENSAFAESTFLDPRFKKFGFTNPQAYLRTCSNLKSIAGQIKIRNEESTVIATSSTAPEYNPPAKKSGSIWEDFDKQVSEILKETNPTAGGIIEVDKFVEEPLLQRSQDPAKWWYKKKDAYPRLYNLFKKRLCIVATSVPSERIFSKAGQIIVERRNRLSGDKVSKLLFLNANL